MSFQGRPAAAFTAKRGSAGYCAGHSNLLYRKACDGTGTRPRPPAARSPRLWDEMSKIVTFIFICLMAVQIIRPLGIPGLRRRADAWKLAVAGFAFILLTIALRPD